MESDDVLKMHLKLGSSSKNVGLTKSNLEGKEICETLQSHFKRDAQNWLVSCWTNYDPHIVLFYRSAQIFLLVSCSYAF